MSAKLFYMVKRATQPVRFGDSGKLSIMGVSGPMVTLIAEGVLVIADDSKFEELVSSEFSAGKCIVTYPLQAQLTIFATVIFQHKVGYRFDPQKLLKSLAKRLQKTIDRANKLD